MSIGIIVIAVVVVGLTAISANGRTPEARKARRDRRLQARVSLEAPADPQLSCYGEPRGEGYGRGISRGNWDGRPGAGRGGVQGCSDCGIGSQGRGAGRGNWSGRPSAGRGRGYSRSHAYSFAP